MEKEEIEKILLDYMHRETGYLNSSPTCPNTCHTLTYINNGNSYRIECPNPGNHKGPSRNSCLKELYYDSEKGLVVVEK